MTLRQSINLTRLLNREASRPITALQVLEAIDRNTGRARCKLQQSGFLLCVPCTDDLPEILDHLVALLVAAVVGVLLPIFDVNVSDTTDQKLELALVEDVHKFGGNELVETGDEGVELFFHPGLDLPLRYKSDGVSEVRFDRLGGAYSTYSFLFSFVTCILLPLGFKSMVLVSPNCSSSIENV
jgi:hypothetical protein